MDSTKTCLFIINRHFYSFEKHIRKALEDKGYIVTVSNDEYPVGTVGKILGKLQLPIIFSKTYKEVTKNYLHGKAYDLILIIKGRGMSAKLLQEMQNHSAKIVGYNWDSFRLNRSPLKWHKLTSRYFTFDYRDADTHNLPVVELYSAFNGGAEKKEKKYELSAVVRNHSGRLKYIDTVISALNPSSKFVFIFENSKVSYLLNFLRNPRLFLKYRKYISFRPLDYTQYSTAIVSSEFTIDYAHHTQTGITMRCFEASNVKTKIITNNEYIKRSTCFNETNCVIFNGTDTVKLLQNYYDCRSKAYEGSPRSIDNFISDLLST